MPLRRTLDRETINTNRVPIRGCFPRAFGEQSVPFDGEQFRLFEYVVSAEISLDDAEGKNNRARDAVVLGNAREYACTRILYGSLGCPARLASSFSYVFLFSLLQSRTVGLLGHTRMSQGICHLLLLFNVLSFSRCELRWQVRVFLCFPQFLSSFNFLIEERGRLLIERLLHRLHCNYMYMLIYIVLLNKWLHIY